MGRVYALFKRVFDQLRALRRFVTRFLAASKGSLVQMSALQRVLPGATAFDQADTQSARPRV